MVKKIWGHHACLGDIMQNIAKMGAFYSFSEGSLRRLLQISVFPINFTKCQFNCIIIVKEH